MCFRTEAIGQNAAAAAVILHCTDSNRSNLLLSQKNRILVRRAQEEAEIYMREGGRKGDSRLLVFPVFQVRQLWQLGVRTAEKNKSNASYLPDQILGDKK